MASRSSRQSMIKSRKQDGQGDRETRAFVALQNRKISRRNDVEKKRGIPLMEISRNENEVQNFQDQSKTDKDTKSSNKDPIKEALMKWKKDKRLRQIQEKRSKKEPFRTVSHVSHQLSEYSHSFQSCTNRMDATKIKSKNDTNSKSGIPLRVAQKNTTATRKTNSSSSARDKKTVTNVNKPTTRSSSRAMKTRSMTNKTSTANKSSSTRKNLSTSTPMETNDSSTPEVPSCTKDLPGRVTRSRAIETEASHPVSRVDRLGASFQPVSMVTQACESIPNNFSFNVPAGVESFVFCGDKFKFSPFTPLSPNSAQKFVPTCTPVKEVANKTEQTCTEENGSNEENVSPEEQEVDKAVMEEATVVDMKDLNDEVSNKEIKKDVLDTNYFRNLANTEIERLKSRCAQWENEDDEMIPEEEKGKIRTVIGQVQLLVTKKFKQFSGLLDLSEDPNAEKKTLVSDLQGFWELMYIQVENIDKKFSELEEMKENNWVVKKVEVKKKKVKRTTKAKKAASKTTNPKVSESRNKFREIRAQMKAKWQAEKNEEQDAFKIILTPMKNKKADADPSEPEIILTPVRRSTRKSKGCATIAIPLVKLPANVSVDLFGSCKTPEAIQGNDYLLNMDDSMLLPRHVTPHFSTADDLMVFSPTTPAKI